jgi:cytochrome c oxidase subunit 1
MSALGFDSDHAALDFPPEQIRPIRWQLYLALFALANGGLFGLLQALDRVHFEFYGTVPGLSAASGYYQGLTVHGVMLALVFTFAFSNSFLLLTVMQGLGRPLASTPLAMAAFVALLFGVLLAGWAIVTNQASVLFTFYPPLKAHPAFYLGLVLVVVSTWLVSANQLLTLRSWRREHPTGRVPLLAFSSIITYVMWDIASLGVALEVLVLLLPWSLDLTPTTDPQLARTLFWFSGHAIVYAWLLPVYVSWYNLIPRQVGGKLFSDPLARLTFLLFLVYSIPVGFHHQFTEAGIPAGFKYFQGLLTFLVFFPSVITAFSVMAALESGGRAHGGRGLFGWIPRLPWGDPSVAAQLLAMLVFLIGGATGLVNASMTMNLVVHNTAFVPGHFHMTVGTAVALSIMGITYWLVPYLTGKALWARRLALLQGWLWAAGVLIFARGQIAGGLTAMPRRTAIGLSAYLPLEPSWNLDNTLTAIGGVIMFVSGALYFVVILGTLAGLAGRVRLGMPVAEYDMSTDHVWPFLDRWQAWMAVTVLLIALAYGPFFIGYLPQVNMTSIGWKLW